MLNGRYIGYAHLSVSAGVSHHLANLMSMLKEAHILHRTLIVPTFHLAAHHNGGRSIQCKMEQYFDYNSITVNNNHVDTCLDAQNLDCTSVFDYSTPLHNIEINVVVRSMKNLPAHGLVDRMISKQYATWQTIRCQVPVNPKLSAIAQHLAKGIPSNSAYIHVRRGDRLATTRACTDPNNIKTVLRNQFPYVENIYIATNEENLLHFESLVDSYNLYMYPCFSEMVALKEVDNYLLFLVEREIAQYFPVRISTFATDGSFYHASLSNLPGWQ